MGTIFARGRDRDLSLSAGYCLFGKRKDKNARSLAYHAANAAIFFVQTELRGGSVREARVPPDITFFDLVDKETKKIVEMFVGKQVGVV